MDRIELNQLAWKTSEPWHGKGIQVPDNATGREMLVAAGLDWTVQKVQIEVPGSNHDQTSSFHAIQRSDNGHIFTVTRDRYNVVQNEQIVDFFKEYCEAGKATIETVGAIDGGSKVWALARLTGADARLKIRDGKGKVRDNGEELRGYVLLATSHDMTLQHVATPTQVCVVCWNTLSAALGLNSGKLGKKNENEFRAKHSRKWSPTLIAEAQKTLGIAVEKVNVINELSAKLAKVSLDSRGREEFIFRVITPGVTMQDTFDPTWKMTRVAEAINSAIVTSPGADLYSRKATMWGAVNGITYFVDHERGREQDTRLASSWFGEGSSLKQKALDVAVAMAGV
jgi:phage/plasmid-like protein (TIGR03299 family)